MLLSFIAPEELEPGKKYLWLFQNMMFILILLFFLAFNLIEFWPMVFYGILFLILLYYVHINNVEFEFHRLLYIASAIILYLSYTNKDFFIIEAAFIFLYGLPVASLYTLRNIKSSKTKLILGVLKNYGFFVVLALLLAFLGYF